MPFNDSDGTLISDAAGYIVRKKTIPYLSKITVAIYMPRIKMKRNIYASHCPAENYAYAIENAPIVYYPQACFKTAFCLSF